MTKTTKENLRAISTIVSGTVGVGFFAIPYSLHTFGTFWGIGVLILVSLLMMVLNIVYCDIITKDKGNHQIPGYVRKYIGSIPAHISTVIIVGGLIGVLFAYALLAGNAMGLLLSSMGMYVRLSILAGIFLIFAMIITRFGMDVISKLSSMTIIIMFLIMLLILAVSVSDVTLENSSNLSLSNFSLIFGVAIFSMYSVGTIPVVDEIIGYDTKRYKNVVMWSTIITLLIYIVFGLITALSFGDSLTSDFIQCFCNAHSEAVVLIALFTLFAISSSFVLLANALKEIFVYDYKLPSRTVLLFIFGVLVWLIALQVGNFETIVEIVGNVVLVLQSIIIFAIWFRLKEKHSLQMKVLVVLSALILIAGMILQF